MTPPVPSVAHLARVVFFTGAGLSAESGLATYRGAGGIWTRYDWRRVACQEAFEADPDGVWEHHEQRRAQMAAAPPNAAHRLIAALGRTGRATTVVTQNVDGLHQRAGSEGVLELHGSVWGVRCDREGRRWRDEAVPLTSRRCPGCGGWLRPDIVWFGDPLDARVLEAAARAAARCDLFVSVGTSGSVWPAAEIPLVARRSGAVLVEVNPQATAQSDLFDHVVRAPASEALPALWPDVGPGEAQGPSR